MKLTKLVMLLGCVMALVSCGGSQRPQTTNIDLVPDSFVTPDVVDAEPSQTIEFLTFTISGINAPIRIKIINGEYSVNNGEFVSGASHLTAGDTITLRHVASTEYLSETITTLFLENTKTEFKSVTRAVLPSDDKTPPTASIEFPIDGTIAELHQLVAITGVVSDDNEVTEILVNEVAVQFEPISVDNSDDSYVYSWSATASVEQFGRLKMKVSATDSQGNVNTNSVSTDIVTPIPLDGFVGFEPNSKQLFIANQDSVYALNMQDNSVFNFSELADFDVNFSVVDSTNSRLIWAKTIEQRLMIYTAAYAEHGLGLVEVLYNSSDLIPSGYSQRDVAYSVIDETLAISYSSFELKDDTYSAVILELDLKTGTLRQLAALELDGVITNMAMTQGNIYIDNNMSILSINRETGAVNNESWMLAFDASLPRISIGDMRFKGDSGLMYGVSNAGVFEFDVSNKTRRVVYSFDINPDFKFTQPKIIGFNGNNILVREGYFIVAIDIESSVMSKFYSTGRGKGPILVAPRAMVSSKNDQFIYISDNGGGANSIFEVEVSTGDRRILTQINPEHSVGGSMALDDANNRLFVLSSTVIFEVNILTGSYKAFSSNEIGTGVVVGNMSGFVLDVQEKSLYVIDRSNSNIIAIDLATKKRSLLSSPQNEEEFISGLSGITLDSEGEFLYVLGALKGELYRINVKNGVREKLLDSCLGMYDYELLPEDSTLNSLDYSEKDNSIYIQGETILKYELESKRCSRIGNDNIWFNLGLKFNNKGQLFTTDFSTLNQIDLNSGSEVIISQY